jgi:hypothetical protein
MLPRFGEYLFSGSRFMFLGVSPFVALCAIGLTLTMISWDPEVLAFIIAWDVLSVLLITALYDPRRFWWAARTLAAVVFLTCISYLVEEIRSGTPWKLLPFEREDTPTSALVALFVIGLPSLVYTVSGRFRLSDEEVPTIEPRDPPGAG